MGTDPRTLEALVDREYKWGFVTEIDADAAPKGLNEDIIRLISTKKNEPEFMLEWRLKAYRQWLKLAKTEAEPKWANIKYGPIDYQDISLLLPPRNPRKTGRRVWMKWTPRSFAPTKSLASHCLSRSGWQGWRWTQCSTVSRWPPRLRESLPN